MNEQPPPDLPAPPMHPKAKRSRTNATALIVLGVISIVGCLLLMPWTSRSRRGCGGTEAIHNARQIGMALFEFETEYGSFPNADTIAKVKARVNADLDLHDRSSNGLFRQLIAADIAQSETMFYVRTPSSRRPDDIMAGSRALEKGECGFAYVSGLSMEEYAPKTPIAMAPMIPGTRKFDRKANASDGRAVVLLLDNSVRSFPITKDGKVILQGMDILDPKHPVWRGKAPDLKLPE